VIVANSTYVLEIPLNCTLFYNTILHYLKFLFLIIILFLIKSELYTFKCINFMELYLDNAVEISKNYHYQFQDSVLEKKGLEIRTRHRSLIYAYCKLSFTWDTDL
jgi:hypothetical protein